MSYFTHVTWGASAWVFCRNFSFRFCSRHFFFFSLMEVVVLCLSWNLAGLCVLSLSLSPFSYRLFTSLVLGLGCTTVRLEYVVVRLSVWCFFFLWWFVFQFSIPASGVAFGVCDVLKCHSLSSCLFYCFVVLCTRAFLRALPACVHVFFIGSPAGLLSYTWYKV